jgi:hypothetical protein
MKNYILLAAMAIGFYACSSDTEKKQANNVALVKNYVKAVENLDFDSMSDFLADNYMGLGPSFGDTIYKEQAVANWKSHVEEQRKNILFQVTVCGYYNAGGGHKRRLGCELGRIEH